MHGKIKGLATVLESINVNKQKGVSLGGYTTHLNCWLIIACSFLVFGCHSSKKIVQENSNHDTEFIDYLFKDYSGYRPGASIVVVKDNRIEVAKGYGYADLENRVLARPNTNYRIASVTKQFTALAVMILIQRGELSYEAKLTDVFPEFPDCGKDITIRHLLTHRSGLVKYNRFIGENRTEQMLDKDVLQGLLATDSTYFPPGTQYAYSNTGYAVLAQIVEKISDLSFPEFMEHNIFKPLGMSNSCILEVDKEIKERAYGYIVRDTSITAKDQSMTSAIQGDGGVYTSVLDYCKWDQALYSDKLIPQAELEDAFYDWDENGRSNENGYGFGWGVSYVKGIKILQHGGSSTGFGSHVIRIPSQHLTVAIFTNRNKRGQGLPHRAKALVSHFTDGKFQMPWEIVVEREIEQSGIARGIEMYDKVKADTLNFSVSKGSLFNFGISYVQTNKSYIALSLFELLVRDHPSYFGGYYGSAIVYHKESNTEKAREYCALTIEHSTEKEKWASDHAAKMVQEFEQR